jgi:MoxR-like ATPase
MGYPTAQEEMDILARYVHDNPRDRLTAVVSAKDILALQEEAQAIYVSELVMEYMVALVNRSRSHAALTLGVSPRGTLALMKAAQGNALLQGRNYCLPDDVQKVALPVLSHRLSLKPEAKYKELTQERIMAGILKEVKVPVMGEGK